MSNFSITSMRNVVEMVGFDTVYSASTKTTTYTRWTSTDVTQYAQYSASRSGSKTPNYRAIIKAGGTLPDNTLTYSVRNIGYGQAMLEYRFQNPAGDWTHTDVVVLRCNQYSPALPSNPFSDTQLNFRLLSKAKGAEWSLPVFLGELKETAGMVTKSAHRIVNMILALKKGNIAGFIRLFHPSAKIPRERAFRRAKRKFDSNFGRDPAKAVSGAWLEYAYGWMPFLKDVDDAFALLSDLQSRGEAPYISSVRTRVPKEYIETFKSNALMGFGGVLCTGTGLTEWRLSGSAVWRFKVKDLELLGKLGLTNPYSAAWNLLTLSFVADWFIPIGNYLSSLDIPLRFTHVGGSYGFKAEGVHRNINLKANNAGWKIASVTLPNVRILYVQRRPMTGIPTPKLGDLSFRADLGIKQATSAVALLSQTVRNVFRGKG